MIQRRQFFVRAGSFASLPLFFSAWWMGAATNDANSAVSLIFEEFASSCIDLGHYDEKEKVLTVRFAGRKKEKFYRYSNIQPEIWRKLRQLNASGGVGGYLNEIVVRRQKNYPFQELNISDPKIHKAKKLQLEKIKAGDSK